MDEGILNEVVAKINLVDRNVCEVEKVMENLTKQVEGIRDDIRRSEIQRGQFEKALLEALAIRLNVGVELDINGGQSTESLDKNKVDSVCDFVQCQKSSLKSDAVSGYIYFLVIFSFEHKILEI